MATFFKKMTQTFRILQRRLGYGAYMNIMEDRVWWRNSVKRPPNFYSVDLSLMAVNPAKPSFL